MLQNQEQIKQVGDALAVTVTVASIVEILPAIAAAITIVWTLIRIYETATVQKWLNRKRRK